MKIKKFNSQTDKEQTLAMFTSYPTGIFSKAEIEDLEKELNENGNETDIYKYLAVDENNEFLGYVEFRKPWESKTTWIIYWLVTNRSKQRSGVGSYLMDFAFKEILKNGGSACYLETCSCEDATSARNFYEKIGMERVGLVPNWYKEGHSKISFYKKLH